jgi:16S rRNA C967 or C1407 C5-methylase (RsmB/RsmF family)/NOL1/NOP2/fmu family ribosome biogenesis protein
VEDLERALSQDLPVSIRLNPAKPNASISTVTGRSRLVPWCTAGRYLETRPVFTLDPLFHAGCYYVQEASSMLLEQAFKAAGLPDRPLLALDLCASPGGKSTHLRALLHHGSMFVSNEPIRSRQAALKENIWKWGHPRCAITGSPPDRFADAGELFDLILVDAPCSGEGLFRKEPFAIKQWNPGLVRQCAARQGMIIEQAWMALKPGGILIYATCTWERAENEDQVHRLIESHGAVHVPVPVDPSLGIITSDAGIRCYPHRVQGEGFFISVVRKPGQWVPFQRTPGAEHDVRRVDAEGASFLVDAAWHDVLTRAIRGIEMLAPGIPVIERHTSTPRSHPALALSIDHAAHHEALPLDVDLTQALAYLRGEALGAKSAQGERLVTYEGHPLGWAHGAGGRWNNRLPRPWRIRMR